MQLRWDEWVEGTLALSARIAASADGRLRLRGEGSLDVVASPAMLPAAVDAYRGWLEALEREGFPVEIRSIDGWRVCVVMEGTVLAIRVRERMRRMPVLDSASLALERLLGGRPHDKLVPSGRLELQVMRHGVSAISIPFREETSAEAYACAIQALAHLRTREQIYQQRLRQQLLARNGAVRSSNQKLAVVHSDEQALRPSAASNVAAESGSSMSEPELPNSVGNVDDLLRSLRGLDETLQRLHPMVADGTRSNTSVGHLASVRAQHPSWPGNSQNLASMDESSKSATMRRSLPFRKRIVA